VPAEAYTECELRRGDVRLVAWIPRGFAVAGQTLRILEGRGKKNGRWADIWTDGWQVETCWRTLDFYDLEAFLGAFADFGGAPKILHAPALQFVNRR
jgi:hypothetical protein